MARKPRERDPRPALSLLPAPFMTLGALVIGLVLLGLASIAINTDGWYGVVWAIPGAYVFAQPVRGFVNGSAQQLRVGLRKINLAGLLKVTVYERVTWGFRHAVVVLKFNTRVEEISGMFLTTKSFTRLVQWFGVQIEELPGIWTPRRLRNERPDLVLLRAASVPKR